ncbi:histidine kinase N-terminal 7TM domain-containing protein [Leptospira interrogans]|uniref:histidine kinase N-terminal 7TM domain-containing protein n=1 Tax=Leptospira interrogans TaxID=173 RepID=UPI00077367D3|nr:histidine kinase N-terminal 7TM domain-containing protein [Leptospira interrogans]
MAIAVLVSFFIFWLGIYVYRNSIQSESAQKWFLLFAAFSSSWIFLLWFRSIILIEYRFAANHFTLVIALFVPYLFFRFIKSIFNPRYKLSRGGLVINTVLIAYFLYCAVTRQFAQTLDVNNFAFKPTINYHIFIIYCATYFIGSLVVLWLEVRRYQQHKIQAILITTGTLIAVAICVLFVYILPLQGIFLAPYSAIGVAIAGLFFAVAALLGNALITNATIESGDPVPRFSRTVVLLVVVIYKYVDPVEFLKKSETFSDRVEKTKDKLWELVWYVYKRGDASEINNRIGETAKEITMESNL